MTHISTSISPRGIIQKAYNACGKGNWHEILAGLHHNTSPVEQIHMIIVEDLINEEKFLSKWLKT